MPKPATLDSEELRATGFDATTLSRPAGRCQTRPAATMPLIAADELSLLPIRRFALIPGLVTVAIVVAAVSSLVFVRSTARPVRSLFTRARLWWLSGVIQTTAGTIAGMTRQPSRPELLALGTAAFLLAGCGGTSHGNGSTASSQTPQTSTATPKQPKSGKAPSTTSPNALQAEANATAAGDIPDNQVFITFQDAAGGYSMKYPEGWAQQGAGNNVTIRDKNNIVRVVVTAAPRPSAARIRSELAGLPGARVRTGPQPVTIGGVRAFRAVYSTESAPNAVTGKRVTLVVDRYYLTRGTKEAVVDLGSPVGVDNVDAYRLMIGSFRWK
jgi:hypothetical protein